MRRALPFVLMALCGCFSPDLGNGKLQCGANSTCPEGLFCHADNHCYTTSGNLPDASVNMPDSAPIPDTRPGTPDAMIDSGITGVQPTIHYTFDNTAANSGTMANADAMLVGTSYGTGKFGQSVHMGSVSAYLTVPNSATILGAGSSNYTVSLWYRQSGADTPLIFSDENRSTAPYGGVQMYLSTSTSISECSANVANAYIEGSCMSVTGTPATGVYHNVIIEYNNSTLVFYLDGVSAHTVASAGGCFNAGVYNPITFGGNGANFDIDDFKIYTQVFTAAQRCSTVIGGTYNAGSGICTLPP